jgi:hypothetical protein
MCSALLMKALAFSLRKFHACINKKAKAMFATATSVEMFCFKKDCPSSDKLQYRTA